MEGAARARGGMMTTTDIGILRRILETAAEEQEASLNDLTVLSTAIDPYRIDTPAGHRDGQWAAELLNKNYGPVKRAHWRGLHYTGVTDKPRKPDGEVYQNTDDDWEWLSEKAGKAARWLGYIPFDRILDQRNAAPIIHRQPRVNPEAYLSIGLDVEIPEAEDIEPVPVAQGFVARQSLPFRHLRREVLARRSGEADRRIARGRPVPADWRDQ
jgi:hypothetical protein